MAAPRAPTRRGRPTRAPALAGPLAGTRPTGPPGPGAGFETVGNVFLDQFDFSTDGNFIWAAAVVLLGYFSLLTLLSAAVLQYRRFELSRGTKRIDEAEDDSTPASPKSAGNSSNALPFTPASLAFRNIRFEVYEKKGKKLVPKKLLRGISGFAKPGTLTALMGASGAGKTTLLDVLAGRKTQGKIDGEILVNGHPKEASSFARIAGYVEQFDAHLPTATVLETLRFSARLRLPKTVSDAQMSKFVDEVMAILELTEIKDRLIGDPDTLGLSPGQLKRVTIGVELVANPSILFLDEPTTGLDSRAALTVMRVVKRIAATGRSVVCTIHQPSAELFYMFDRLLLLQTGGYECYFGGLGHRGRDMVKYFERMESVQPKPKRVNPASWMLDVIGAGAEGANRVSTISPAHARNPSNGIALDNLNGEGKRTPESLPKFAQFYHDSPMKAENQAQLEEASKASGDQSKLATGFAASHPTMFWMLMARTAVSYWRDTAYNYTRIFVLGFLGVMFGLVYFRIDDSDQAGATSKVALLVTCAGFCGVINAATTLPVLIKQRAVFYREKMSGTYHSIWYTTAIFFNELPYVFLSTLAFAIPFYYLVDLENTAEAFWRTFFGMYMNALCFNTFAQMLASLMPNIVVAGIAQGTYFNVTFLFAGLFIPGPSVPKGWLWVYAMNSLHWSTLALGTTQFKCRETPCPTMSVFNQTSHRLTQVVKETWVADNYGLQEGLPDSAYWEGIGYLFLIIVIVRVIITVSQQKVMHIKR